MAASGVGSSDQVFEGVQDERCGLCFRLEGSDSGGEGGVVGCELGDVVIYLCGR